MTAAAIKPSAEAIILTDMKRIISLVVIAMVAVISTALYAGGGGKAKIVFEEVKHDFGNIQEAKGAASHTFEFVNEGNANLVIIDVTAQCGCTRPEYPKSPIAPGKKGKIKVTFNPNGRPGGFEKVVTVRTNGSPGKVRLKITGNVIPKAKK